MKEGSIMAETDRLQAEIYHLIYKERQIAKQEIAARLGLSLPTVTKYLKQLLSEGMISRQGTFSSTGGRPAETWTCNPDAGIAVGVEIRADQMRIASVNLYGDIKLHREFPVRFENNPAYYQNICRKINTFLEDIHFDEINLLGMTVAIQGIVSDDGQRVLFCGLLDNADIRKDMFEPYLSIPFDLVHDAEAACYAELFMHDDLHHALYLSLNRYLGSAMILNGRIASGVHLGAGIAEHMIMDPSGKQCYCGSRGCADTILGIKALEAEAGISVEQLFTNLYCNEPQAIEIFGQYLRHLARLIHNVMMIAEGDVIIGGYMENFLQEEHYRQLEKEIRRYRLLEKSDFRLIPGFFAQRAATVGAGLMRVRDYLESWCSHTA